MRGKRKEVKEEGEEGGKAVRKEREGSGMKGRCHGVRSCLSTELIKGEGIENTSVHIEHETRTVGKVRK